MVGVPLIAAVTVPAVVLLLKRPGSKKAKRPEEGPSGDEVRFLPLAWEVLIHARGEASDSAEIPRPRVLRGVVMLLRPLNGGRVASRPQAKRRLKRPLALRGSSWRPGPLP